MQKGELKPKKSNAKGASDHFMSDVTFCLGYVEAKDYHFLPKVFMASDTFSTPKFLFLQVSEMK